MTKGTSSGLPLEQTITIINNSGKLISTGKQLLSVWKTAQASYREKKSELKQERAQERAAERSAQHAPIQRSQTFDPTRSVSRRHHSRHDDPDDDKRSRRTYDDQSVTSSRRSKGSHSRHHKDDDTRSLALTADNLKALSVVSSTAPSRPPPAYHSPYAETLSRGALSKPDHAELRSIAPTEWTQAVIPRRHSEPEFDQAKDDDMHLAYGNIPPDLHQRNDLDPKDDKDEGEKVEELVHKIENLLDEAHCAQHSATAIIKHLQEKPQAAAAVALALAELSTFVAKLSPGFVAMLKGGSPAVFALLASPQFLIGTGIAVGVTVVMFGGWKIIQKVAEAQMAKQAMAFEGRPLGAIPEANDPGVDEALVVERVEDELSTIETWRRGIPASWEQESADLELITPTADRATKQRRTSRDTPKDPKDPMDDFDSRSRRSSRTHKSSKSHKSKHEKESSDKKSRRGDDEASVASSSMSKKSRKKKDLKALDDVRSVKSEELPFRTKPRIQHNMLKALFKNKKGHSEAVLA